MAVEIKMPQLSDTMGEGKILTWLKNEGDQIKPGDELAEVATDKADLPIESFHSGVLLKVLAPVGQTVKVGSVIAIVGEAGESVGDLSGPKPSAAAAAPTASAPASTPAAAPASAKEAPVASPAPQAAANNNDERIKISPLARNIAKNHGIDVSVVRGSGEGGRIVKRDIEGQMGAAPVAPAPTFAAPTAPRAVANAAAAAAQPVVSQSAAQSTLRAATEPLSKMRQTIADRMVESATTIPHFYVTAKLNAAALVDLRETLKTLPQYEGITFNHLMIKACGLALAAVPRVNARYEDGSLVQAAEINIGIITAVGDGLLIPIVKNADVAPLADVVGDARALVQRARSGKPKPGDLVGGTFCISNMGMYEVENFTAIISPGQGGILSVSAINDEAVVVDGQLAVGKVLRVTLSVDHRIIDGVVAGEFLKVLKRVLEKPVLLLA